jgi:hypothetical protein
MATFGTVDISSLAALRNNVLQEVPTTQATYSTRSGLTRKEPFYSLPAQALGNKEKVKAFAYYLYQSGTSAEESREKWRSFILTWVSLTFPGIKTKIVNGDSNQYEERVIDMAETDALLEWYKRVEAISHVTDIAKEVITNQAQSARPDLSLLPSVTTPPYPAPEHSCTQPGIYGYMSMVMFLAGKKPTEQNCSTFTENVLRP